MRENHKCNESCSASRYSYSKRDFDSLTCRTCMGYYDTDEFRSTRNLDYNHLYNLAKMITR